jgi:hypothetical protein
VNRRERREIVFAEAVERGGTKPSLLRRKVVRRNKSKTAKKARRTNRGG